MISKVRFNKLYIFGCTIFIVALLSTSCGPSATSPASSPPATVQSIYREIKNDAGGSISLEDGLKIELPAGSLYEDQDILTVRKVEQPPQANTGYLEHVGEFYSIELENDNFFRGPVRVDIPYDENKLPNNRSEEEVFATFLANGVWHRIYGAVDTQRNIVSIYTIHNGFWSTAFDSAFNFVADVAISFGGRTPVPETIEDAKELVELRRAEFIEIGLEAENAVTNMEDYYPWKWAIETFQGMIVLGAVEKGVEMWAGSTAVAGKLVVGGVTVGTWFALAGIGIEAYHMIVIADETVASAALILKSKIALKRLYEAEAILYVLEHPELQTIRPEYQQALQDHYHALAADRQITPNMPIDFSFTAYPYPTTTPPTTTTIPLTPPPSTPEPNPESSQGKIAFSSQGDIYVMNADGSNKTNLTNNDIYNIYPAWSPNGTKIAFDGHTGGTHCIYLINVDGSNLTCLVDLSWTESEPSWSPDGSKIAFVDVDKRGYHKLEMFIINADGSNKIQITDNDEHEGYPRWSTDGTKIAFEYGFYHGQEIYVMNSDGTNRTQLTNNYDWDGHPDWSQ